METSTLTVILYEDYISAVHSVQKMMIICRIVISYK